MVRIDHILCPIDFSQCSRHALDRAVAFARAHGAAVTALYVMPAPVPAAVGVPLAPEGPGPFMLYAVDRDRAMAELSQFSDRDIYGGVPIAREVADGPSTHREILVQADRLGADLIVMGTHGRSGVDHLLLGSVTEKVLRRANVPVLTVPVLASDGVDAGAAFERIVCAVDFSDCSQLALRHAAALARERRAHLTILHVVELLPIVYEPSMAMPFDAGSDGRTLELRARGHLKRFVPAGIGEHCELDTLVTSGKPYVEILKLAAAANADLIVLGVHGHGAIDRLLFGSTTAHVVRRAPCAVLTVREPDPALVAVRREWQSTA